MQLFRSVWIAYFIGLGVAFLSLIALYTVGWSLITGLRFWEIGFGLGSLAIAAALLFLISGMLAFERCRLGKHTALRAASFMWLLAKYGNVLYWPGHLIFPHAFD